MPLQLALLRFFPSLSIFHHHLTIETRIQPRRSLSLIGNARITRFSNVLNEINNTSSNMLNETNSRLSNLPNEILDRVLSSIPTSALPKICLVSKSLRRAAEPFLYSDATSRWSDGMTPPMAPLLRTLLKKPKLFAFIETVTLQESFLSNSRRARLHNTQTPVRQFLEVIGQSREPYRNDDWILDLHTGQMSAIAATLISNLTRTTVSLLTTISSVAMTLSSKFFDQTFLISCLDSCS